MSDNVEFTGSANSLVNAINQAVEAWKKYIAMGYQLGTVTAKITEDGIKVSTGFQQMSKDGTVLKGTLTGLVNEAGKFSTSTASLNTGLKKNIASLTEAEIAAHKYYDSIAAFKSAGFGKGLPTSMPAYSDFEKQSEKYSPFIAEDTSNIYKTGEAIKNYVLKVNEQLASRKKQLIEEEQTKRAESAQKRIALEQETTEKELQIARRENIKRQALLREQLVDQIKIDQQKLQQAEKIAQQAQQTAANRAARRSVAGVTAGPVAAIGGISTPDQLLSIQAQKLALEQLAVQAGIVGDKFNTMWGKVAQGKVDSYRGKQLQLAQGMRGLQNSLTQVGKEAKTLGQHIDGVLFSWQSMVRLMVSQAILSQFFKVLNYLSEGIQTAQEFSIRIGEIQTISQDANYTSEQWSKSLVKLSDSFGIPVLDQANAAYQALSNQVVKAAEVTEYLTTVNKFSIATVSTATEAQNLIGAAIKSFHLEASDAERVAATFFKTIEVGRVRASDMAESFGRVAVVAAETGVELEELQSALSVLTVRGLKYSDAATQLRGIFVKLLKPTNEMKELFRELGVETAKQGIELYGFGGFMGYVEERTLGAASEVAKLFSRVRGLTGALVLSGEGLKDYDKNLEKIRNSFISYDKAVTLVMETEGYQIKKVFNEIKNYFTTEIGQTWISILSKFNKHVLNLNLVIRSLVSGLGYLAIPMLIKWIYKMHVGHVATANQIKVTELLVLSKTKETAAIALSTQAQAINTQTQILNTKAKVASAAAAELVAKANQKSAASAATLNKINLILLVAYGAYVALNYVVKRYYKSALDLEQEYMKSQQQAAKRVRERYDNEAKVRENALQKILQVNARQTINIRKQSVEQFNILADNIKATGKDIEEFFKTTEKSLQKYFNDSEKISKKHKDDIVKLDDYVKDKTLSNQKFILNERLKNEDDLQNKLEYIKLARIKINSEVAEARKKGDADALVELFKNRDKLLTQSLSLTKTEKDEEKKKIDEFNKNEEDYKKKRLDALKELEAARKDKDFEAFYVIRAKIKALDEEYLKAKEQVKTDLLAIKEKRQLEKELFKVKAGYWEQEKQAIEEIKKAKKKAIDEERNERFKLEADILKFEELKKATNKEARKAILESTDPEVITKGSDELAGNYQKLIDLAKQYKLEEQDIADIQKTAADFAQQSSLKVKQASLSIAQKEQEEAATYLKLILKKYEEEKKGLAVSKVSNLGSIKQRLIDDEILSRDSRFSKFSKKILEDKKVDLEEVNELFYQLFALRKKMEKLDAEGEKVWPDYKEALENFEDIVAETRKLTRFEEELTKNVEGTLNLREKLKEAEEELAAIKKVEVKNEADIVKEKLKGLGILTTETGLERSVLKDILTSEEAIAEFIDLAGGYTDKLNERLENTIKAADALKEVVDSFKVLPLESTVVNERLGGVPKMFALGGHGSDRIPALLSQGEFVVNRGATGEFYSQLIAMNSGVKRFESGGSVTNVGDVNISVASHGNVEADVVAIGRRIKGAIDSGRLKW